MHFVIKHSILEGDNIMAPVNWSMDNGLKRDETQRKGSFNECRLNFVIKLLMGQAVSRQNRDATTFTFRWVVRGHNRVALEAERIGSGRLSIVDSVISDQGWAFSDKHGCILDTVNGADYLWQILHQGRSNLYRTSDSTCVVG